MSKVIISVYDVKADVYSPPFFVHTKGEAIRSFADEVQNENSAIGRHPEDYHLFCLGDFIETTGEIRVLEVKERIALASDFVKIKE